MFKGFFFFMKFGWHADKRYVLYNILNQIIRSMIPVVSVIMPKYIIDELENNVLKWSRFIRQVSQHFYY